VLSPTHQHRRSLHEIDNVHTRPALDSVFSLWPPWAHSCGWWLAGLWVFEAVECNGHTQRVLCTWPRVSVSR